MVIELLPIFKSEKQKFWSIFFNKISIDDIILGEKNKFKRTRQLTIYQVKKIERKKNTNDTYSIFQLL